MTALLADHEIPRTLRAAAAPAVPASPTRCNVLGVGISAVNLDLASELINFWISDRQHHYVCITGVHGVMESQSDQTLRRIHNEAGMVTPDGMPMVWLNQLAGNRQVSRVYGPDLMLKICQEGVARGLRHYFYGGGEGVATLLASMLQSRVPGLKVVGTCCPPFRKMTEAEDAQAIAQINATNADIVWVGLSTPKQEFWMSSHLGRIDAPVMIGVGAAFDFHAGLKRQAPVFMQKSGTEWLYRLATEPGRLWKRYLKNNPLFVFYLLLSKLGIRRRTLDTGR
jgi:N-acetylglucosaminyldiphosphoundecaprenol N-acetyl-beta-D-mannosaminyltransferase